MTQQKEAQVEQAAERIVPLEALAANDPQRPAIWSQDGNRTFSELNGRANQLARALQARGLVEGDGVALICANRPEFPEVIFAALRSGLRLTPINWHLSTEEMAYIVQDCGAKALIAHDRFATVAAEVAQQCPDVSARLSVAGPISGFEDYDLALKAEADDKLSTPLIGTTMLYTSGTTGRPKGVHRTSTARPSTTMVVAADYKAGYDVHLCTGPAYHAAPMALSLMGPLSMGITVVMMDGWNPEETLRLIERHRVTHAHMVPTMFHRLLGLDAEVRERYDVSSMRFILHGAAPCPVQVKQDLITWFGPIVYEYYAATEGGGTFIGPDEWLAKPGSVGRPMVGQVVEVWGPDETRLKPGEIGTVYFLAPEVGRFEYYKDNDKTEKTYSGNYFTLGDMGYFDEDGFLFLTGRTAELIISGGVNIYPAEVDAALLMHPVVADVATVGVPNHEWGEEVKSVVQLRPGNAASPELATELIAFAREHLAHFKAPRTIDFDEQLPRHDTGKIYRRLVRDRYWKDGKGI
ncbi:MAG: AMP-binding protein [Acidimicrobiales bacterium]